MRTHIISAASVTTSTDFRITRAFEGDYADYGHQQTAASELILSWYDPPPVHHRGGRAFYSPPNDTITAFLCGRTGISPATIDNSAAYLASWLKVLQGDGRPVLAAAAARRAVDPILGRTFAEDPPS